MHLLTNFDLKMHILKNRIKCFLKFKLIILENAIPIKSWFSDPTDTCLLNILPFLDALRFTSDVRSILGRNQCKLPSNFL